jgi:hypothetical protein
MLGKVVFLLTFLQFSFRLIDYNNYIEQNTFYVKDVINDRKKKFS